MLTVSTLAEGPTDRYVSVKRWMKRRFDPRFVPLARMGEQLAALGCTDYEWSLPGGWFGYTSAHKVARRGKQDC